MTTTNPWGSYFDAWKPLPKRVFCCAVFEGSDGKIVEEHGERPGFLDYVRELVERKQMGYIIKLHGFGYGDTEQSAKEHMLAKLPAGMRHLDK